MKKKMQVEELILVDEKDREVGVEEKLAAHRNGGLLHRAFSIFIFNRRGEMLLQKRAATKYHFRGLWSNACCGHPRPGEELVSAAERRLREELGIETELEEACVFTYTAEDPDSQLTEKELDHVLVGRFDGIPQPHPDEIDAIRWVSPAELDEALAHENDGYAPWFRIAAARLSALETSGMQVRPRDEQRSGTAEAGESRKGVLRWRRWGQRHGWKTAIVAAAAIFLGVFVSSIEMRAPWRGHLARGDHYVTGQGLRWVRTWHREGALATRFALVLTPPTSEYEGDKKLIKWALPGHLMLLHAVSESLGTTPDVELLMRVNLALHLTLALLLALLAYTLSLIIWPTHRALALLSATHCGIFVLWFPPILYWGQNLSCQYFTVLPLLVVCVSGRWLRSSIASPRARIMLDGAVAASVVLGTMTDFLFWLLVPYLVCVRWIRARKGRPRTADPWKLTLLLPYLGTMVFLFLLFLVTDQLITMVDRGLSWTLGGKGLIFFLATRVWFFGSFAVVHFYDAFGLVGLFCVGYVLFRMARRPRVDSLPWMARGIILDLLLPCLLFSFILAPHQAVHTIAAMKYVPFVALAWTVAIPFLIGGIGSRPRLILGGVYAYIALSLIWPGTSGYRRYFPNPEIAWEREADFLRENTETSDFVFSTITAIDILPPQRIALAERAVHHVYGPLDVLRLVRDKEDAQILASYAPEELHRAFGAGRSPVHTDGDFSLARFTVGQFHAFMSRRPDTNYRHHLDEILSGGLVPEDGALRPHEGGVVAPSLPVAMHVSHPIEALSESLYWASARQFHSVSPWQQHIVLGDKHYEAVFLGLWKESQETTEREAEWGAFLIELFQQVKAKARAGEAWRFQWRLYDVIRIPVDSTPRYLRDRASSVDRWEAYLIFRGVKPIAVALGPESREGEAVSTNRWVSVLFENIFAEIRPPDGLVPEWKIRKVAAAETP